jgi:hypothetical protein
MPRLGKFRPARRSFGKEAIFHAVRLIYGLE